MSDSLHIVKLIDDMEYAAGEYAQAAADAADAGHEHGDSSPAAHDAYRVYANWRAIVADAANSLRVALGVAERRPDVEAYVSPVDTLAAWDGIK
jgi:hypothetical protein